MFCGWPWNLKSIWGRGKEKRIWGRGKGERLREEKEL
jgi:hypothetical protein